MSLIATINMEEIPVISDTDKYLTVRDIIEVFPYAIDTRNKFKILVEKIELKRAKFITTKSLINDKVDSRSHTVKLNCYNLIKAKKLLEKYISSLTYTTSAINKQFAITVLDIVNKKIEKNNIEE